jgi:hypothetical protein
MAWMKVMTLPEVKGNNFVKFCTNLQRGLGETNLLMSLLLCELWPWPFTNDLGSISWHFLESSVTILWNIPIHAFSENLWPGQCLNHYEYSDLDLWPITLDQGHDTSWSPEQQSCKILFKFIKKVRRYGRDKLFAYVLTIMCIVTLDQGLDTSLGPV